MDSLPVNMKLTIGGEDVDFLARLGLDRDSHPAPNWIYPVVWPPARFALSLVHGAELDDLLYTAFDCDDTGDTFRGRLREVVECTKTNILTSLCGYRIGFEWDHSESAELALLVTVLPGSLANLEAAQLIPKLQAVLTSHDERLNNVAIEIAEQAIILAANGTSEPSARNPADGNARYPADGNDEISYQPSPLPGASIGLEGSMNGAGTLGAFFGITVGSMPTQYYGMTCSHVLSCYKAPSEAGQKSSSVACPADTDNFHWWLRSANIIKFPRFEPDWLQEAETQKLRAETFQRTVSTMYASLGVRTSLEGHWLVDWALFALRPKRFQTFENLHNTPSRKNRKLFENKIMGGLTARDVEEVDWKPRGTRRYVATGDMTEDFRRHVRVFKAGRTTGCTTGYLHTIDPSVTIRYFTTGSDGVKHETMVKGKVLVVLENYRTSRVFADLGDSGALVLNGHAEAVGTVTAIGRGSPVHCATYVSPFHPAVDDMREVLQRAVGPEKVKIELL